MNERKKASIYRRHCVWTVFLILLCAQWSVQQRSEETVQRVDDRPYEWDPWDYYQILGLATTQQEPPSRRQRVKDRAAIKAEDIKKAYRKQAQLWHPDKIASRKHSNASLVSVDESNARFSRIAQAYETLANADKRVEYDIFLLNQEDKRQEQLKRKPDPHNSYYEPNEQPSSTESFSSFFNNFPSSDPWAIFENFFFGPSDPFSDAADVHKKHPRRENAFERHRPDDSGDRLEPTRVSESTQVRYDAQIGNYVHRVLHREEYDRHPLVTPSTFYFRVIGQEFIENFHPLHGYSLGYTPITATYLVEEGLLQRESDPVQERFKEYESFSKTQQQQSPPPPKNKNRNQRQQQQQQQQRQRHHHQRQKLPRTSSRLESNQYISTKNEQYLRSENQYYYAGLTPDCELVIMYDKGYDTNKTLVEDPLVWTSESYVPYSYLQAHGGSCFLALYDGQLTVCVGENPDEPISVLWSSTSPSPAHSPEDDVEYYASLDNDGSLVVYRRIIIIRRRGGNRLHDDRGNNQKLEEEEKEEGDEILFRSKDSSTTQEYNSHHSLLDSIQVHWKKWWTRVIQTTIRASKIPPKTHAARAWKSMHQWAVKTLTGQNVPPKSSQPPLDDFFKVDNISTGRNNHGIDECVFATSPAGCLTPGRLVIQASRSVKRSVGKAWGSLDTAWEKFMYSITDELEEDGDLVDITMRLFGKVGNEVGKAGIKIARNSLSGFHRVAKAAQEALGNGWKEQSEWTEEHM